MSKDANERFVNVPLMPSQIRWLLEQIGAAVAADPIRDEVEMELERALGVAESRERGE